MHERAAVMWNGRLLRYTLKELADGSAEETSAASDGEDFMKPCRHHQTQGPPEQLYLISTDTPMWLEDCSEFNGPLWDPRALPRPT